MNKPDYETTYPVRKLSICHAYVKCGLGALISSPRTEYLMNEERFENDG